MESQDSNSKDVARPVLVQLLSQRGEAGFAGLESRLPHGSLNQGDVEFTTDPSAEADVVVVQNYVKYDTIVTARSGYIWKWDNEPIVKDPPKRAYDKIFTHLDSADPRFETAPPILDWWVEKTYEELSALEPPKKTSQLSAIASTKDWITGHRARGAFIEKAIAAFPQLDVFGRGRPHELDDKWQGLAPYRYSIAIENTSKPDYWTEKIADCFLSFTVPFYYGASNIADYFPPQSYIWLPINNQDEALEIIHQTLSDDNWQARIPALTQARELILNEYSLGAQLLRKVRAQREQILGAPRVRKKINGRRTRPGGWRRGAGIPYNIKSQAKKYFTSGK